MSAGEMRSGIALGLFDRPSVNEDLVFELDAERVFVGRTLVGWSSRGETFDYVPASYTRIPRDAEWLSNQPPELRAILEAPGVELGLTLGVLTSVQGSIVAYGATLLFEHPQTGRTRYLVPLAAYSASDSAEIVIPAMLEQGEIGSGASPFLPHVAGTGTPDVLEAKKRPSALNCILQTTACVAGITVLATACLAACATATPACIACIMLSGVSLWICCSACNCWKSRGVSISCSC